MSRNPISKPSPGADALAIISDIHGNLEALVSVLGYIESIGVQRIVCLGDIVGYGPNPVECIRQLRQCETLIVGDWDAAAISSDDPCWSTFLLEQLRWVRDEIAGDESARQILKSGCVAKLAGDIAFFHAMPRDFSDWVFPEDVFTPRKLDRIVEDSAPLAFCGQNHLAGVYLRTTHDSSTKPWTYKDFLEVGDRWFTPNGPCICSVGSVGQPRDNDPRASFVILRDQQFRFVRVEYDHQITADKIRANPLIRDIHADRLSYGR